MTATSMSSSIWKKQGLENEDTFFILNVHLGFKLVELSLEVAEY